MTAIHETAYPRIRSRLSARELAELYTPTPEELALSERHTKSPIARLGFLVTMKSFQRLGYCPAIGTVPPALIRHIAALVQLENVADRLQEYEKRQFHWKHVPVIRAYLDIGGDAQSILEQCEAYLGYAGNNYLPFLPALFHATSVSMSLTACGQFRPRRTKHWSRRPSFCSGTGKPGGNGCR